VDVLLNLKHFVLRLQVHADRDIQRLVLVGQCLVVGVLHVTACKLVPFVDIHIILDKLRVEVFNDEVLTLQVHNRTLLPLLVNQHNRTDTGFLSYKGVVSTEVWRNMYDTSTVIGSHVIARNHFESIAHGLDGGHQLFIFHANEVSAFVAGHDAIGNQLLTFLIFGQFTTVGDSTLSRQIGVQTGLGQHQRYLVGGIGIVRLYSHVVNLRTYAKG